MPNWNAKLLPVNFNLQRSLAFILLLLLLATAGCRSSRTGKRLEAANANASSTNSSAEWLAWADSTFQRWDNLEIRGNFDYREGKDQQKAQYRLHMQRDSLVWVSVSVMGIEGVRLLITRDSILVINRLEHTALRAPYDTVRHWLGFVPPLADFQRMLIGLPPRLSTYSDSLFPPVLSALLAGKRNIQVETGKETRPWLESIATEGPSRNPLEAVIEKTVLHHSQYQTIQNGVQVPFHTKLKNEGSKPFTLQLAHKSIEANVPDLSFSFRIPDGYR